MSPRPLAPRVQHLPPSATLAVKARAEQLRASGVDVLNFTAGEPDTAPAPHILEAAQRAIRDGKHYYTPSAGITELRAAIADKFTNNNRIPTTTEQVIVTNGGKEGLYLIFQTILGASGRGNTFSGTIPLRSGISGGGGIVRNGESGGIMSTGKDEVIIASPTWVSFAEQIRLAGGEPVSVRTDDRFHLTAGLIAPHITPHTAAIVINSPANPTGAVLTREEVEAIAVLAQQHDLWVIADEVYEHFLYDNRTHTSIASLPGMAERTLTVNACSKTYSMTGWRVGYVTGPKHVIAAMSRLKDHLSSNVNAIAQYAALAALTGPQEQVDQMRRTFEERRAVLVKGVSAIPGLQLTPPEGAFYGFIDARELMRTLNMSDVATNAGSGSTPVVGNPSTLLCEWLLEHARVAVVPGEAFGPGWNMYIRWSFAADQRAIEEGIRRVVAAVKEVV